VRNTMNAMRDFLFSRGGMVRCVIPLHILGTLLLTASPSAAQDSRHTAATAAEPCAGNNGGITLPPDTQFVAAGAYRDYSAWPSLLPRYWYPIIESSPASTGTRFGAQTSGADVCTKADEEAGDVCGAGDAGTVLIRRRTRAYVRR